MTTVLWMSVLGSLCSIMSHTLIRRKDWRGWLFSIASLVPLTYVWWQAGAWGYIAIMTPFYFCNGCISIYQWRFRDHGSVKL